jgi:lipid-binding SYLF domain-containing protein
VDADTSGEGVSVAAGVPQAARLSASSSASNASSVFSIIKSLFLLFFD